MISHIEMARPVDNLKGDELVVHQSRVRILFLVNVVVGTDKSLCDESDDHGWKGGRQGGVGLLSRYY